FDSCCDLASIHSVEESDELAQYISENLKSGASVWIGLNDAQKAPGEPNNAKGNEYCVELRPKTGADSHCPNDWLSKYNHCYKIFDDQKNWNDAEMFCRKQKPGCHLASIHSSEESADVAEYISDYIKTGKSVWIGLKDPKKV
ncbi:hypothetical protein Chor_008120, partial [Crotalus horridus]